MNSQQKINHVIRLIKGLSIELCKMNPCTSRIKRIINRLNKHYEKLDLEEKQFVDSLGIDLQKNAIDLKHILKNHLIFMDTKNLKQKREQRQMIFID